MGERGPLYVAPEGLSFFRFGPIYDPNHPGAWLNNAVAMRLPPEKAVLFGEMEQPGKVGIIVSQELVPTMQALVSAPEFLAIDMVMDFSRSPLVLEKLQTTGLDEALQNRFLLTHHNIRAARLEAQAEGSTEGRGRSMAVGGPTTQKGLPDNLLGYARHSRQVAAALKVQGVRPFAMEELHFQIELLVAEELAPFLTVVQEPKGKAFFGRWGRKDKRVPAAAVGSTA